MTRHSRFLPSRRAASLALLSALVSCVGRLASAQDVPAPAVATAPVMTFRACYDPSVGALYLIKLPGLSEKCLRTSHLEIVLRGGPADDPTAATAPSGPAGGDLSGTYPNPSVARLQGTSVAATVPAPGQALFFAGGAWRPVTPAFNGDITGGVSTTKVVRLQSQPVAATAPTAGQVLQWDATALAWTPSTPAGGVTAHNQLSGLAADDHAQYLPVNGVRGMGASLTMNGFKLTNLGPGSAPGHSVAFEQAVKVGDAAAGDLAGQFPVPTVDGLLGRPVLVVNAAPAVLTLSGDTLWETRAVGGDVMGPISGLRVQKIQGQDVSSAIPTPGQVLQWDQGALAWTPSTPASGVTKHDQLLELTDDDHAQYLLANGVRDSGLGFAVTGTQNPGVVPPPVTGPGARLMWFPSKTSVRGGLACGTEWDAAQVGISSTAFGECPRAGGNFATAVGRLTNASGTSSTAMGDESVATGNYSVAGGWLSQATGVGATAFGERTKAWANHATVFGRETRALGLQSFASGYLSEATADNATAMGFQAIAWGVAATALGWQSTAGGTASAAIGYQNNASGFRSIAIGNLAVASGSGSVAIGEASSATETAATALGYHNTASGNSASALGNQSVASGVAAVTLGLSSTASGFASIAMGNGTTASGDNSTAMGTGSFTNSMAGSFVYSDATNPSGLTAIAPHEFAIRASGGVRLRTKFDLTTGCDLAASGGVWNCTSSKSQKADFADVNDDAILADVRRLPVQTWRYKGEDSTVRHMGPFAEDFRAIFHLGTDSLTIGHIDVSGVALAAAKALETRTRAMHREFEERTRTLRTSLEAKDAELARLRDALDASQRTQADILNRLAQIERRGQR